MKRKRGTIHSDSPIANCEGGGGSAKKKVRGGRKAKTDRGLKLFLRESEKGITRSRSFVGGKDLGGSPKTRKIGKPIF